ncbi:MAG: hypothetical protein ACXWQO_17315, partial [Bdellovibrionota bacterium]
FLLGDGIGTTAGQSDNFFVWGARAGIDLSDSKSGTFSLGLNFETKNESLRVGSVSAEANMYLYEAEILSRRILGSVIYAGARAGIGVLSVDIKSPNLNVEGTGVSSVFGPVLGAEVPISKNVNFNLDFYWAHASKGNLDVGSTKYPYLKSSAILLQGGFVFDWR